MILILLQISMIFLVPFFIIRYSNFIITRWIGTIGSAYFFGLLVALFIFLLNTFGVSFSLNTDVGEIGSHAAIAFAIPLLLFSANLLEARKLSKTALLSFLSLIISAITVTTLAFYLYGRAMTNGAEISSMAIALYTGGTPNLNALGNIYRLQVETIGVANLSDMIIGAFFYLFLLLLCKPLLSKILKTKNQSYAKANIDIENVDSINLKEFAINYRLLMTMVLAFIITLIGAIIGILIWIALGSQDGTMIDILVPSLLITVTILGIAGSFNKTIRQTKGMNLVGQYFILVFSFALASSLDFSKMQGMFGQILILYGLITIGMFVLHTFLSYLFNIDADCTMVTLTAGLYGPAFVPAITKQIKNDALTAPGLIVGSIGYAIGTFLGLLLGLVFLL